MIVNPNYYDKPLVEKLGRPPLWLRKDLDIREKPKPRYPHHMRLGGGWNPYLMHIPGLAEEEWLPIDVDGCVLWLRSDLGITKDGDNGVSQWAGQNGAVFVQAIASKQPLWRANQWGIRPGIVFSQDTMCDFLEDISSVVATALSGEDKPFTIFFVGKINEGVNDNSSAILQLTDADEGYPFLRVGIWDGPELGVTKRSSGDDGVGREADLSGIISYGDSMILTVVCPGTTLSGYINGNLLLDMNNVPFNVASCAFTKMRIGLDYGDEQYGWEGPMGELIIYNSPLSDPNRSLVENYLNGRYAIY